MRPTIYPRSQYPRPIQALGGTMTVEPMYAGSRRATVTHTHSRPVPLLSLHWPPMLIMWRRSVQTCAIDL